MMAIWPLNYILIVHLLILLSAAYFIEAESDHSTAQVGTSWTNNNGSIPAAPIYVLSRKILWSGSFSCGFYQISADSFSFAVAIGDTSNHFWNGEDFFWLANKHKPVGENATLELLPEGNLVLRDADGSSVWSTNTSNKSVAGMMMKETGNLVLYDRYNNTVWQSSGYPTAQISTSWTNNDLSISSFSRYGRIIMHNEIGFACGFCEQNGLFYFAIWKTLSEDALWLANRNRPVGENATLQLLSEGDLVLRDADGTFIWSTNTSNISVVGMEIMETGNLVLYDVNNETVWQSFDHPADVLLLGQKLMAGQKLVASVSSTDSSEGYFTLSVIAQGVFAFYRANVSQKMYFKYSVLGTVESIQLSYDKSPSGFANGLALSIMSASPDEPNAMLTSSVNYSATAYMKFDPDGHLRLYDHDINGVDLLEGVMSECDYPTTCGNYGLCSDGKCSCPAGFARDNNQSTYSCSEISPPTCENRKPPSLLPLEDVYYFNYVDPAAAVLKGIDVKSCKEACLKDCSCKAALFQYNHDDSHGNCFLPSPVLTLTADGKGRNSYQSSAFLKISNDVANATDSVKQSGGAQTSKIIAGSSIGAILFIISLVVGLWVMLLRKKRDGEEEMEDLDQLSGMPMRFTFQELRVATWGFERKLGEGGFGSVFEGILENGENIAVKRLDALGQGKKEFLAEVKTIGSIHHVNLVRLIGFCADKLHRLLVYEFMCNGSLDKWIFCREPLLNPLDWKTRRNVILDIAKGLAYLHEDCRQRIVHLDIKPKNILLDVNLHAKISDFGLSKLIDRDQSQVATTMRGTPGYLAPELFSSVITDKADVYSFGIVVMEVVCGRKNLDRSQPERMHLLPIFMNKAQEDQLVDMVDNSCEDMKLHMLEAVEMMKVAIWCLQSDYSRRPSMSTVVKVLEGTMGVEAQLDHSFQNATTIAAIRKEAELGSTSVLLPSLLSGPR